MISFETPLDPGISANHLADELGIDDYTGIVPQLQACIQYATGLVSNYTGFVFGVTWARMTLNRKATFVSLYPFMEAHPVDSSKKINVWPNNDAAVPKKGVVIEAVSSTPLEVRMSVGTNQYDDALTAAITQIAALRFKELNEKESETDVARRISFVLSTLPRNGVM